MVVAGASVLACEPAEPAQTPARTTNASANDLESRLRRLHDDCEQGDACACFERAAALVSHDGRAAALGEAARLYEKLCESSAKTRCTAATGASAEMVACYNWAQLLGRGAYTAPDPADAEVLEKRACAGGLARACTKAQ